MDKHRRSEPRPANRLSGLEVHQVENVRRSIAMLAPGQPALNREEALVILGGYQAAAGELHQLQAHRPGAVDGS